MMRPSRRKATVVAVGVGGVLAIVLGGASVALAQDPGPTPSASSSAQPAPNGRGRPDPAARRAALAESLATELGVDKEKVAAALAKFDAEHKPAAPPAGAPDGTKPDRAAELKTRLDAAVKAGTITQAEADAIIKAQAAGVLGGPHR